MEQNINDSNKRLDEIEDTLKELKEEVMGMKDKLNLLYLAVVGNQDFEQIGLVGKVKKLEESSETIKEFKNKIIGIGAGAGVLTAFAFEFFKKLIFK